MNGVAALLGLLVLAQPAWCADGEIHQGGIRVGQGSPAGQFDQSGRLGAGLAGEPAGFARAMAPRPFSFPADHGPHPDYRSEWWYFTGNLESDAGRAFGFQLTFFRFALAPDDPAEPAIRDSAWASRQVYMAHFTLSDIARGQFHAHERFSRDALDLAGARAAPLRVWLQDWQVAGDAPDPGGQEAGTPGGGLGPLALRARADGRRVDLVLTSAKPPVLQGERGLSRKGADPGNASYYYSVTRMAARGRIDAGDGEQSVIGTVWMDREWGTSALGPDQVGWDWFGLQLSDGRDLMFYRLRRRDGSVDPHSAGTLVEGDGTRIGLAAGQVTLDVLAHWTSPRDGTRYPARWRLRVPDLGLDLEVTPRMADQELDLAVRYWEGAVTVSGRSRAQAVRGHGYMELTGYAD